MPSIDDAMKASLRRGVADVVVDAVKSAAAVVKRHSSRDVSSVENSFSSWDNCMAADYCK